MNCSQPPAVAIACAAFQEEDDALDLTAGSNASMASINSQRQHYHSAIPRPVACDLCLMSRVRASGHTVLTVCKTRLAGRSRMLDS